VLKIIEIFMPAGCLLIDPEIGERNHGYIDIVNIHVSASPITLREYHAIDFIQHFDSNGGQSRMALT